MASVTYDHVTKKFGETVAVDDLDIKVDDREFLVLVGPSGCGKTTALRCLAGLEEITDGRIMIGDRVVNDVAPKDRDIAMVFQSYALYPHLSVFDNMAFRPEAAQGAQGSDQVQGREGGRNAGHHRAAEAPTPATLRRSAAASGRWAGHRP